MIRMITAPHFNYNFSMFLLQMSARLKDTISDYHKKLYIGKKKRIQDRNSKVLYTKKKASIPYLNSHYLPSDA